MTKASILLVSCNMLAYLRYRPKQQVENKETIPKKKKKTSKETNKQPHKQ